MASAWTASDNCKGKHHLYEIDDSEEPETLQRQIFLEVACAGREYLKADKV